LNEVVLWAIVLALMFAGLLGSLLPIIPGPPLILLAGVFYGVFTDFQKVNWFVILTLAGITLFALGIDWLATVYGAKRRQASIWGIIGGILGGILGFVVAGIAGLLLGVFLMSLLAEWIMGGQSLRYSMGVGWASLMGFLGGTLLKVLLSIIMVGIFLYAALS
jgi:uncharacterized protein YqgC (DUF456 family)